MKICNFCFTKKPLDEFYKKSKSRQHISDGHENRCKKCTCLLASNPKKKRRANELRRKRGKTEKEKEANKLWEKKYYTTEQGKEKRRKRGRKYYRANREKMLARQSIFRKTTSFKNAVIKYRQKYPERRKAQTQVANAIASGKLIRPDSCTICMTKCKPEGHHPDYSKPLEVIWVCKKCHTDYHWSYTPIRV